MSEVWYVMEDGSIGDPLEVSPDDAGVLHHSDGRAVAYRPHGPRSRMVSAEEMRPYRTREMKPAAPKRKYTTRAMKSAD